MRAFERASAHVAAPVGFEPASPGRRPGVAAVGRGSHGKARFFAGSFSLPILSLTCEVFAVRAFCPFCGPNGASHQPGIQAPLCCPIHSPQRSQEPYPRLRCARSILPGALFPHGPGAVSLFPCVGYTLPQHGRAFTAKKLRTAHAKTETAVQRSPGISCWTAGAAPLSCAGGANVICRSMRCFSSSTKLRGSSTRTIGPKDRMRITSSVSSCGS